MKAIWRQRQLFRRGPPLPASVCSSTGVWQSASDCVISPLCRWSGQPATGASHFSTRMPPPPLPVPGRSPGSVRLYVCQTEEFPPSVTLLSSFLRGWWKASLTALLIGSASSARHPSCQLSIPWTDHIKHSNRSVWCSHILLVKGKNCIIHEQNKKTLSSNAAVFPTEPSSGCFLLSALKYFKHKSCLQTFAYYF